MTYTIQGKVVEIFEPEGREKPGLPLGSVDAPPPAQIPHTTDMQPHEGAAPAPTHTGRKSGCSVTIGEVSLSAPSAAAGEMVQVSALVGGRGVAYIYFEAMLYDAQSGRLWGPLLREHILSPQEKTTGGVVHPDWEDEVEAVFDYWPSLRILTSGEGLTFAFLNPEGYPMAGVEQGWTAEGQYTFAQTGNTRRARMSFGVDGALRRVTAFKKGRVGDKPSTVTVEAGDAFAPRVLALRAGADGAWQEGSALASRLVLTGTDVHWVEAPALAGEIYAGFAVKDFDDHWVRRYAPLLVKG